MSHVNQLLEAYHDVLHNWMDLKKIKSKLDTLPPIVVYILHRLFKANISTISEVCRQNGDSATTIYLPTFDDPKIPAHISLLEQSSQNLLKHYRKLKMKDYEARLTVAKNKRIKLVAKKAKYPYGLTNNASNRHCCDPLSNCNLSVLYTLRELARYLANVLDEYISSKGIRTSLAQQMALLYRNYGITWNKNNPAIRLASVDVQLMADCYVSVTFETEYGKKFQYRGNRLLDHWVMDGQLIEPYDVWQEHMMLQEFILYWSTPTIYATLDNHQRLCVSLDTEVIPLDNGVRALYMGIANVHEWPDGKIVFFDENGKRVSPHKAEAAQYRKKIELVKRLVGTK